MNFLGLDIGTTTIGLCVCNEAAQVLYCAKTEHKAALSGRDFEALQDAHALWQIASNLLNDVPLEIHIDGIGIANQMHSIVYVSEDGRAVSPLYTWQDARGAQPYGETSYTEHAQHICGHSVPSGYGLMTHYYNIVNNEVSPKAHRILDIGNFIAGSLSGLMPHTVHPSQAQAYGFYHTHRQSFDLEALKALGVNSTLLPHVAETHAPLGYKNGIPIYAPLGDNQAGFLGATAGDEHAVLINIGTSGQLSFVETAQTTRSNEDSLHEWSTLAPGWECRPFIGEAYLQVASTLCAGKSIALWVKLVTEFAHMFSHEGTAPSTEALSKRIYKKLQSLVFEKSDLRFNPQFYGTRSRPNATASLENISEHNFCFKEISLALIQGIVDELYALWDALPQQTRENKRHLCLTGGACAIPAVQEAFTRRFTFETTTLLSGDSQREDTCIGAALWACRSHRASS